MGDMKMTNLDMNWLVVRYIPSIILDKKKSLLGTALFHRGYPKARVLSLKTGVHPSGIIYWCWCRFEFYNEQNNRKFQREAFIEWKRFSKENLHQKRRSRRNMEYIFQVVSLTQGKSIPVIY